jgi:hypothetical protein
MLAQQLEDEKKKRAGHLREMIIEERKAEIFVTTKGGDFALKKKLIAIDLRNSKKQELL